MNVPPRPEPQGRPVPRLLQLRITWAHPAVLRAATPSAHERAQRKQQGVPNQARRSQRRAPGEYRPLGTKGGPLMKGGQGTGPEPSSRHRGRNVSRDSIPRDALTALARFVREAQMSTPATLARTIHAN